MIQEEAISEAQDMLGITKPHVDDQVRGRHLVQDPLPEQLLPSDPPGCIGIIQPEEGNLLKARAPGPWVHSRREKSTFCGRPGLAHS